MIAYLAGKFAYKNPTVVYVETNGVGYEVNISLNTYSHIQNLSEGKLFTYLQIKEDSHTLYGFYDVAEKEMFLHVINVSGIGASTARMMLSYMKPDELARAIINGDVRTLEGIKGIGKKTAERLVVELKDKLAKHTPETNISTLKHNTLHSDALNALLALGINRMAADQAIQKTLVGQPNLPLEDLIKKALRTL